MRCRSRSCSREEPSGNESFYTPRALDLDKTPGYGLNYHKKQGAGGLYSVDSGIASDEKKTPDHRDDVK